MLFRKDERRAPGTDEYGAVRPTTFREDPSERTHMYPGPEPDYTVDNDGPEEDIGFESPDEKPVPVHVVSAPPNDRSYRDWSSGTYAIGSKAVQVASYDRRRHRLRVTNLDNTNPVYATRNSTDLVHTAYTIAAGATEEFFHNSGVWLNAGANTVNVTVYSEYELDEFEDVD